MDDAKAWFSQPQTGSAETGVAPFWRMLPDNLRLVIVRRDPADVLKSLLALPGIAFNAARLSHALRYLDRKLDQVAKRNPDALVVRYEDLASEETCCSIFEHCLPYRHDPEHWASLAGVNVQCDMRALTRYAVANKPAMDRMVSLAKHRMLADMARQPVADSDAFTFQVEDVDTWQRDGVKLFEGHCAQVNEDPREWSGKNWPLFRALEQTGAMQIMTARSNGRMFGYLMSIVAPSLTAEGVTTATNLTFFADKSCPGLGMKLQRKALEVLRERGVDEVFWETGFRGDGPRLGTLYRRLGAQEHGQTYRLPLAA